MQLENIHELGETKLALLGLAWLVVTLLFGAPAEWRLTQATASRCR